MAVVSSSHLTISGCSVGSASPSRVPILTKKPYSSTQQMIQPDNSSSGLSLLSRRRRFLPPVNSAKRSKTTEGSKWCRFASCLCLCVCVCVAPRSARRWASGRPGPCPGRTHAAPGCRLRTRRRDETRRDETRRDETRRDETAKRNTERHRCSAEEQEEEEEHRRTQTEDTNRVA